MHCAASVFADFIFCRAALPGVAQVEQLACKLIYRSEGASAPFFTQIPLKAKLKM